MAAIKIVPVEIGAGSPILNPRVTQEQAWAVKALIAGEADAAQQGIAMRFILGVLADVEGFPYHPSDRDTAFANGRRYVGHHLLKISRMTPDRITNLPKFVVTPGPGEDDEMPNM